MAAIAKFITYDGGIAFSDSVIKIQKRESSRIIPLEEVASLSVRKPREDADGFIWFQLTDGKKYRLFFEDDQLSEAVQFKEQFDALSADTESEDLALAPLPEKAVARRPGKSGRKRSVPYQEQEPAPAPGSAEKKSVFRRWWFWLIVAILAIAIIAVAVSLLAGNLIGGDAASSGDQSVPAASEGAGTVGEYAVEIKDAFKTVDYEGKDAIVITYAWTNNSQNTISSMAALVPKAFQDGVQMDTALLMNVEGYDASAYQTEIRPGTTLDVQQAYLLASDSLVEFEVGEFFGLSDPVTKNFDPTTL